MNFGLTDNFGDTADDRVGPNFNITGVNSETGAAKVKLENFTFENGTWYDLRYVYNFYEVDGAWKYSIDIYVDDTSIYSKTDLALTSAQAPIVNGIAGVEIKTKHTRNFKSFDVYFGYTTLSEYTETVTEATE